MFKRRKPDEAPESVGTANPPGGASTIFGAPTPSRQAAGPGTQPGPVPAKADLGLPLRPNQNNEASMSSSRPPVPPAPTPGLTPSQSGLQPPPPRPAGPASGQRPQAAERRTLVVGRGISVQGSVQDAERLVVEGTVEATNIRAAELAVAPGGVFRGEVEVEEVELAGTIDGTLVAHGTLVVRASGKLLGSARCRRLQVEDGGQISGRIEMLTDAAPASGVPPRPVAVGEAPKPVDRPAPVPPAPASVAG